MGDKATEKLKLILPQPMADSIKEHGMETRVTEYNLKHASDSGITLKDDFKIFLKLRKHSNNLQGS
jgi:hypothetical protein